MDNSTWDGVLFLLGGVICVAAVIGGLKLGGGLGLLVGVLVYIAGAYLMARGYGGPAKPTSTSSLSIRNQLQPKLRAIGRRQRPKRTRRPAATTSLGEITFTVGTLLVLVALVLGLTGVLSGNAALLLGIVSFLLAGAAYGGIK